MLEQTINQLADFQQGAASEDTFLQIYGDYQGEHLYQQFVWTFNSNLLTFWLSLDPLNRIKLAYYISTGN